MEDKREEYKKPEFIYVEEPYEERVEQGFEQQKLLMGLKALQSAQFPPWLRIASFLGAVFCGFVAIPVSLAAIFWFAISAITLFKVETVVALFNKTFKLSKKLITLCIGLLVGVFNPALGLGFIILYFLMSGEELSDMVITRITSWHGPDN